jgi:uncharacterized membrane protein YdjX (TVP38/TMEM64 family)
MEPDRSAPPRPARSPLLPRLLLVAGLAAAVILFYASGLQRFFDWHDLREQVDGMRQRAHQQLPLALLLFFLVYTAATAFSLPAAWMLSVVAGALFDRWLGTAVVSLASTAGATLAFLTSRYLLRDFVQRRFGERLRVINDGVEKDGAYYLLTLRLVILFPFWLVNLCMGLTPIRLRTYVWVSWLGMLPGTFLYVNAGQELGRINSPRDVFSPGVIVSLALIGVVPLAARKLIRWREQGRPS